MDCSHALPHRRPGSADLATVFYRLAGMAFGRQVSFAIRHTRNQLPPRASRHVAPVGPILRSERVAILNLGPPKITTAAVPRKYQERWPVSEPRRAATPFEQRGMFDTKIQLYFSAIEAAKLLA